MSHLETCHCEKFCLVEIIHLTYKLYKSKIQSPNLHNLTGKAVTQEPESAIQISANPGPKHPEVACTSLAVLVPFCTQWLRGEHLQAFWTGDFPSTRL